MSALVHYDAACRALADAKSVDEVKDIRDKAEAIRAYARQAKNRTMEIDAAEIRMRAERRLGVLIAAQKETVGLHEGGRPKKTGSDTDPVSIPTLADAGIDKHLADRARKMAAVPEAKFEAAIGEWRETVSTASERVTTRLLREATHDARRPVELPDGKYRIIYADPPWQYGNKGLDEYGHAERHYPTLSIADLCEMEVEELATDDAVLFLWVTSPLLAECFAVINAWGFEYKTSFVWDKIKHNFGHYNSVRHELLLVCTRGSCVPDNKTLYDSVQSIERAQHSTKPEEFRRIIDDLYPHGSRIELFARTRAEGWHVFGNEPGNTAGKVAA